HLAPLLDLARHRAPGGFDLAIGNPGRLQALQSVFAETDRAAAIRDTFHAAAHLLAMLNFFRHQHSKLSLRSFAARSRGPGAGLARIRPRFIYRIGTSAARHRLVRLQNLSAMDPRS